jgi:hypothetical protein
MKYRSYFIGTVILSLIGIGLFAIFKPKNLDKEYLSKSNSSNSGNSSITDSTASNTGAMIPAKESKSNDRKRSELKNPDLVSKYGESRVNLSRHITSDLVAIMNDLTEMGGLEGMKKMVSRDESKNDSESEVAAGLGTFSKSLNLTTEQMSKTATLLTEVKRRKMASFQEMIKQVSKDPTAMMTNLLISDAAARREIDEPEFKRLKSEAGNLLENPSDFLNFETDAEMEPLKDNVFVRDLKSLLDPEQQMMVENELKNQVANDKPDDSKADESEYISQPHLEEVDTLASSAKKMLIGVKSIVEEINNLKKSITKPSDGN